MKISAVHETVKHTRTGIEPELVLKIFVEFPIERDPVTL
jgi:hypothetical protein